VMRSLCLDIGLRRIGVAVSDTSKLIARPLLVIDRKVEDALKRTLALLAEQQVDEIVVGYPYHIDGKVSEQAVSVDAFVAQLRQHTPVPVLLQDERWSTTEAREIISAQKRKKQPVHDDALAAAVILQRYLEERSFGL
jgi:putative holliday junction resolvase